MFKIFKKDIKLFIQDKKALTISILLPIILISLFGFIFKNDDGNKEHAKPIKLLLCDEDNSQLSNKLISILDSCKNLSITESDYLSSINLISRGKNSGVLIIKDGFEDSLAKHLSLPLEIKYDKAHELEIRLLQSIIINKLLDTLGNEMLTKSVDSYIKNKFSDMDESILNMIKQNNNLSINFKKLVDLKVTSVVGEKKNINLGLIQAIAGTATLILLFSVTGHATSIIEEKENGTINRLLCSPLKVSHILFGKMLSAFFIALVQLSIMFLFAVLLFRFDITINFPTFIILVFVTIIAVIGFGFFLASICNSRQQAENLSTIVIIVMSTIGGSMVPLYMMPDIMEKIAIFSINYWVMQSFFDIYWRLLSFNEILPKIIILLFTGLTLLAISIYLFKRNINKIVQ
jgi:ABC-2 type transport system permease protein